MLIDKDKDIKKLNDILEKLEIDKVFRDSKAEELEKQLN